MVLDEPSGDSAPLQYFERQLLSNYPWIAVVMTVILVAPYAEIYEGDPRSWDWLIISGVLLFLIAYPLSLQLPDRAVTALRQLKDRGVLAPKDAVSTLENNLNISVNRWAVIGGMILAAIMGLAWLIAFLGVQQEQRYTIGFTIPGVIVEVALSIAAGRFIGRALCYCTMAHQIRAEGITIHPIPDHPDGAAGLGPIGRLYFLQTMLIVSITAFLSVWLMLLPSINPNYDTWQIPYAGLLVLMLALEAISLLWPLHSFNAILVERKHEMLAEMADRRYSANEQETTHSDVQPSLILDHRDRVERMSTWVIDSPVRWGLVFLNVLLAVPLILFVA